MMGFADVHSHFVYGMDDGARTRSDMEAMLDAAHADGIVSLFATPHVVPGVQPFDFGLYQGRLEEARRYCREKGYPMTLLSGAEVLYTPALRQHLQEHELPVLGDSDRVLLEFVPDVAFQEMEAALSMLRRAGYAAVLAHIDRYECLFHGRNAERLKARFDVGFQVNAGAVLGRQGLFRTWKIRGWFQKRLVDFVASDAHHVRRRPFQMKAAYAALERRWGSEYAGALTRSAGDLQRHG